ncbi:MAG: hypothetical protein CUN56_00330 [Phototrophicales bacterium]|nr:MAG: hypothetical protein CUN56_00330 [Phototrophicales bacterium]
MKRLAFLLFLLIALPIHAQLQDPLIGPLVAVTPAQQDRILIHDIANGNTRTLRFGYGELHVWDFSPDGCRILFTLDSDPARLPRLYSARLDGSDVQEMVVYQDDSVRGWGVWEPDWSPTGLIAFTMIRDFYYTDGTTHRDTHIAYIDGAAPAEPEFYSVTGREYTPTWSPDGTWLAYISYDRRMPGDDIYSTAVPTPEGTSAPDNLSEILLNEADLWVVSADAQTKYRLTNFMTGSMRAPRWSPDGELIGFIYSPSPNNDTFWMIGNSPNALPTQLSGLWNLTLDHTWLPDSSAMLASVRDFRGIRENRLWRIPLVGNADDTATLYIEDDTFIHTDFPRFSADGRYLAFRNAYSLVVIDTINATWQRFDENLPGNTPPIWSPAAFTGEASCLQ